MASETSEHVHQSMKRKLTEAISVQLPYDEVPQQEVQTQQQKKEKREPPKKKRKVASSSQTVGLLGPGWELYDATGFVPHYTQMNQVPQSLRKCAR